MITLIPCFDLDWQTCWFRPLFILLCRCSIIWLRLWHHIWIF